MSVFLTICFKPLTRFRLIDTSHQTSMWSHSNHHYLPFNGQLKYIFVNTLSSTNRLNNLGLPTWWLTWWIIGLKNWSDSSLKDPYVTTISQVNHATHFMNLPYLVCRFIILVKFMRLHISIYRGGCDGRRC